MAKYCDSTYTGHEYDLCLVIAVDGYPATVGWFQVGYETDRICGVEHWCNWTRAEIGTRAITDDLSDGIFRYLKGASSRTELAKRLDELKVVEPLFENIKGDDLRRMRLLLRRNAKRTFAWLLRGLAEA
jgi:hypothetical protein